MVSRAYPDRPFLAVSAAIIHEGRVLLARRAREPAHGLFTLPGGVVEAGETLAEAAMREVEEETGLLIEPGGIAGYRDLIHRDTDSNVERHFVILAVVARLVGGTIRLGEEISETRWVLPSELAGLATTEGLAEIVAAAFALKV